MQLSIIYIVHLLVMCCEYMQNARYKHFQDDNRIFAGYKFVICSLIICNEGKGTFIIVHSMEVLGEWKHLFIYLSIHSFIQPFIHSSINSFIDSCIHSLIHWFMHSRIHSSIRSFIHPFIHSSIH